MKRGEKKSDHRTAGGGTFRNKRDPGREEKQEEKRDGSGGVALWTKGSKSPAHQGGEETNSG